MQIRVRVRAGAEGNRDKHRLRMCTTICVEVHKLEHYLDEFG